MLDMLLDWKLNHTAVRQQALKLASPALLQALPCNALLDRTLFLKRVSYFADCQNAHVVQRPQPQPPPSQRRWR